MTFFENQAKAKRNTGYLIALYIISVALLIVGIYIGLVAIIQMVFMPIDQLPGEVTTPTDWWQPDIFVLVAGVLLFLITVSSLFKIFQLRSGGKAVADMLGGRLIMPDTTNPNEKRILNVVEEVAIASGVKVPPVYLLDHERSINAFAAGFSPSSAVIGISRGTIELLNRDELQGVVAHEFSHILNGDMRLNIRLIGVLHGILFIALAGYMLMRITGMSAGRSRSSRSGGNAQGALMAAGLLMMVLGYIGVFFAKMIKSAVSRQREYLADASAVQFTRYPDGIAGALKKIGGLMYGSQIEHPRAVEASHMFFANGLKASFLNFFSTHPPLQKRILAIEPSFDGNFLSVSFEEPAAVETEERAAARPSPMPGLKVGQAIPIPGADILAGVGMLSDQNLTYAKSLISSIPLAVQQSIHDVYGARAVVYCLLLDRQENIRKQQLEALAAKLDQGLQSEMQKLLPQIDNLNPAYRLPLIDMALPALMLLSKEQYQNFREMVDLLAAADREISLFEYTLKMVLVRHLDPHFGLESRVKSHPRKIEDLLQPVSDMLFALAFLGNQDPEKAAAAYHAGAEACGIHSSLRREPSQADQASLEMLDNVLDFISGADPGLKEKILKACIACIDADGKITLEEAELIRAISDALDCPMPPFFQDHLATPSSAA